MNGFLCKIKKTGCLLIHSATLEITIGAGGGCDLSVIYKNSICMGASFRETLANINLTCPFIHHTWGKIYSNVYPALSFVCNASECWGPPMFNDPA